MSRVLCDACAAKPYRPPRAYDSDFDEHRATEPDDGRVDEVPADWLDGDPMDPAAETPEPLPTIPGFPFLHAAAGAVISGPTGAGRSSLVQACAYDAACAGVRVAYLGSEVTQAEFNARAADLADRRCHVVTDELRGDLARVRYLNLASVLAYAWGHTDTWVSDVVNRFDLIIVDPLSSVASTLDLDFDNRNVEFVRFYDKLVQPVVAAGVTVVMLENIGHDPEARGRAKGVSAKQDRADLTFSCKLRVNPVGLIVTAHKVRTIRAPFKRGDAWTFDRETQRIETYVATGSHDEDGNATFRPTWLMERVSRAVEEHPGLSKRAIRESVTGRASMVDLALELLVSEGYIEARNEGAQRIAHHSLTAYREADDTSNDDRVPTVSQPCPGHGEGDRVPVSRPKKGGHGTRSSTAAEDETVSRDTVPDIWTEAHATAERIKAEAARTLCTCATPLADTGNGRCARCAGLIATGAVA